MMPKSPDLNSPSGAVSSASRFTSPVGCGSVHTMRNVTNILSSLWRFALFIGCKPASRNGRLWFLLVTRKLGIQNGHPGTDLSSRQTHRLGSNVYIGLLSPGISHTTSADGMMVCWTAARFGQLVSLPAAFCCGGGGPPVVISRLMVTAAVAVFVPRSRSELISQSFEQVGSELPWDASGGGEIRPPAAAPRAQPWQKAQFARNLRFTQLRKPSPRRHKDMYCARSVPPHTYSHHGARKERHR